jgi:hypothetical protein
MVNAFQRSKQTSPICPIPFAYELTLLKETKANHLAYQRKSICDSQGNGIWDWSRALADFLNTDKNASCGMKILYRSYTMYIFDCRYVFLFMLLCECENSLPLAFIVASPLTVKRVSPWHRWTWYNVFLCWNSIIFLKSWSRVIQLYISGSSFVTSAVKLGFYFLWIYIFFVSVPIFVDPAETFLWIICIVVEYMFILSIQLHAYILKLSINWPVLLF